MKRLVIFLLVMALLASGYLYRHSLKSVAKSVYVNKIKTPTCAFTKGVLPKMRKDAYSRHRNSGKRLPGMELIADDAVQTKLIDNGTLIKITNSDGYRVNSMDYGSPYLHKDMYTLVTKLEQDSSRKLKSQACLHLALSSPLRLERMFNNKHCEKIILVRQKVALLMVMGLR